MVWLIAHHMTIQPMFWTMSAVLFVVAWLSSTRFGLVMTAVRNDGQASAVFGVNCRRTEVAAFVIGASFAGIAGALYAHHFNYIEAQHFNVLLSTYAVLYALLGGLRKPRSDLCLVQPSLHWRLSSCAVPMSGVTSDSVSRSSFDAAASAGALNPPPHS